MAVKKETIKPFNFVSVNHQLCLNCGACVGACPANAMFLWNSYLEINEAVCTLCSICIQICPVNALCISTDNHEVVY